VAKTTNNVPLFNNSAQLWNHSFYWDCMAPAGQNGQASTELEKLIKEAFGSVADFKKKVDSSSYFKKVVEPDEMCACVRACVGVCVRVRACSSLIAQLPTLAAAGRGW